MDIFSSKFDLSRILQNSLNEIQLSPSPSASWIVRSAIEANCSVEMCRPTNMRSTSNNSSRVIRLSSSKSYILNAKRSFASFVFSLFSWDFFIGRKQARPFMKWRKLIRSPCDTSLKNASTIRWPSGFTSSSGILKKSPRDREPLSSLSKLVNRDQRRNIWLSETVLWSGVDLVVVNFIVSTAKVHCLVTYILFPLLSSQCLQVRVSMALNPCLVRVDTRWNRENKLEKGRESENEGRHVRRK